MTLEMGILLAVLAGMAVLFFTEKLPVELTAFVGLVILTLGGYVSAAEAFTGFASPAVITMLSIFFVSAALLHTGVADVVAGRVHKVIGDREVLLIVAIMLVSAVLSAFMNNIAAVAVLLPAVASICKKTGIAPSRLFMPLSFGAILGGTTTLVGTPPNILAAELLRERDLPSFSLFDFTPIGLILLGCGVVYMITVGRWLLPKRTIAVDQDSRSEDLTQVYDLQQTLLSISVPVGSKLDGVTLGEAHLGRTTGAQVVGIVRDGKKQLAPGADAEIRGGDVLLIEGQLGRAKKLLDEAGIALGDPDPDELQEALGQVQCISARVGSEAFVGRTLREMNFRQQYGAVVVGIRREGKLLDADLASISLALGDELIAFATPTQLDRLTDPGGLEIAQIDAAEIGDMRSHLFLLRIHAGSSLMGSSIREARIGELTGLTVAGIIRKKQFLLAVRPKERIRAGDQLLVVGEIAPIRRLVSLGDVQLKQEITETGAQTDEVGMVEVTLAPRSRAAGRTLAEIDFREKTGLQVRAIWSKGKPVRTGLAQYKLQTGDALLVQGTWQRIQRFGSHPEFVVLTSSAQEQRRTRKAPVALGALAVMIVMVATGFAPIHVAAFTAATLVALFGAVTMEEAYRSVEWKAIFLVAAILPAGIAIERTGAAALAATGISGLAEPLGAYGVLAGIVTLASGLSQCLDGAPSVVLMAPVVIPMAEQLGISIHSVMMAAALAASAAFMTPFSHKANLLVMGAGGYKVTDYLKVGTPLTLVLLGLMVVLVPLFFPF